MSPTAKRKSTGISIRFAVYLHIDAGKRVDSLKAAVITSGRFPRALLSAMEAHRSRAVFRNRRVIILEL